MAKFMSKSKSLAKRRLQIINNYNIFSINLFYVTRDIIT